MAHFDPDLPLRDEPPDHADDLRDQILDSARDDVPSAGSRDQLLAAFDLAPASLTPTAATGGGLRGRYAQILGIALAIGAGAVAVSFVSSKNPRAVSNAVSSEVSSAKEKPIPLTTSSTATKSQPAPHEPEGLPAKPESIAPPTARAATAEPASPTPGTIHEGDSTASRTKQTANRAIAAKAATASEDATESSLGREVARLTAARSALGRGDASRTLELLDSYDTEFPSGTLSVEVSVLRIEALMRSGRAAEARRLGDHFLAEHPQGAFARRVANTLEPAVPAGREPASPPP